MVNDTETYKKTVTRKLRQILALQAEPSLDDAKEAFIREMADLLVPLDGEKMALLDEAVEELRDEVEQRVRRIAATAVLHGRRQSWYQGDPEDALYWPALREQLLRNGLSETAVNGIGDSASRIVAELGNPDAHEFDVRGLVVGHVQSGKTASMTAVIAKAADAGYNLIVVLAGLTDALRHQTQERLERDMIHRLRHNWYPLTEKNSYDSQGNLLEGGEYRGQPTRQLPNLADQVMIAVMKKNNAPLRRMMEDIRNTPPAIRNRLKMLLIDDEADQASPNAGKTDEDPTPINRRIRELLETLPARNYVGYTATPYANVLISPCPEDAPIAETGNRLNDLYPRDFIIALDTPEEYFGAERIFGRAGADPDEPGADGLDVVREIDDEEVRGLVPSAGTDVETFAPELVRSLEEALDWFLLAVAARLARGHADRHMSMLIHTSHRVAVHASTRLMIAGWLERIRARLGNGDTECLKQLEVLWNRENEEVDQEPSACGFDEVAPFLQEACNRMEIVMENSVSDKRLDQSTESRAWLVVGGNILARGITLPDLMVSFFLRNSRQYDTLLQMARWFGYRTDYEDLVRIWMTPATRESFRRLALVEHELREEIREYALRGATPMDFAVRIRTLPGLQVTARNRLRHARTVALDYFGQHLQTIRFDRCDAGLLLDNWQAGGRLLEAAGVSSDSASGIAAVGDVLRFLDEYRVHPSHRDLAAEYLGSFIDRNRELLDRWSVAVVQPNAVDAPVGDALGPLEAPGLIRRARLNTHLDDCVADIKALMSRTDVLIDLPADRLPDDPDWRRRWSWLNIKEWRGSHAEIVPLILLYPVDRESNPSRGRLREPMDAPRDVLGFAMVFPGEPVGRSGASRYISVTLPEYRDVADIEDEEDEGVEEQE